MKAVILAAGKGTRMMPLTADTPKPLLLIQGKPFIWYAIDRLHKAGFTDIGIIYSHLKEQWEAFLKDYDITATLILQEKQWGTGDAVKSAREFLGNEAFFVINGDSLFPVDELKAFNNDDDFCYLGGMHHDEPARYGVLVEKDGKLQKIVEKPKTFVSNTINAGVYKFTSDVWDALDRVELSERGEFEITDAVSLLAEQGKVKVLPISEIVDFSRIEDVEKVSSYLSKNT